MRSDPLTHALVHQIAVRQCGPRLDAAWLIPDLEQHLRTAIQDWWQTAKLCRADHPEFKTPKEYEAWMETHLTTMRTFGAQVQET